MLKGVNFILQFGGLLGLSDFDPAQLVGKLDEMLPLIQEISNKFKNPVSSRAFNRIYSDTTVKSLLE